MNLMALDSNKADIHIDKWYVDNGGTSYVTNRSHLFLSIRYFPTARTVTNANSRSVHVIGKGNLEIEVDVRRTKKLIALWFVHSNKKNFSSVLSAQDRLPNTVSEECVMKFIVGGRDLFIGIRGVHGGLYKLIVTNV